MSVEEMSVEEVHPSGAGLNCSEYWVIATKLVDCDKKLVKSAVLLIAGLFVPHSIRSLSKASSITLSSVIPRARCFKRNGVWQKDNVSRIDWLKDDTDNEEQQNLNRLAFVLDAMVGEGLLVRTEKAGELFYESTVKGGSHAQSKVKEKDGVESQDA